VEVSCNPILTNQVSSANLSLAHRYDQEESSAIISMRYEYGSHYR
jgi:hypothetical protein